MQPCSMQRSVHQSAWFSKVHNCEKLYVRSSEWDDTRCVTYAGDTLDHNRKFSEIKRSKMFKLVRNFAKRSLLLDSSRQNSPKRPCFMKVGDFTLETFINQLCCLAMPPLEKVELLFLWSISVCVRTL